MSATQENVQQLELPAASNPITNGTGAEENKENEERETARTLPAGMKPASDVNPRPQQHKSTTSNLSSSGLHSRAVKWHKVIPVEKPRSYVPTPRHGHKAVACKNSLIIFGGGNEQLFEGMAIFDTVRREWLKPQKVCGEIPSGCAAFGMVVLEEARKILICGGMKEYGYLSHDIYELNMSRWEWKKLCPGIVPNEQNLGDYPCPRMGHSFTLIGTQVFLFGGLTNAGDDLKRPIPEYLNDLYIFHLKLNPYNGAWEAKKTFGTPPTPRESHSTVAYSSNDGRYNKLIVFGGMCGNRLGDLYVLDVDTMMWSKMVNTPYSCAPRSLHSATIVGERMYIFGGWVENPNYKLPSGMNELWKCSNSVHCLNVETMSWESAICVKHEITDGNGSNTDIVITPPERAGHCAAAVNNRIYVWSGRDGYNKQKRQIFPSKGNGNSQMCFDDMWYLDVQVPDQPVRIKMARVITPNCLHVAWNAIPSADSYVVQIMVYDLPTIVSASIPNGSLSMMPNNTPWAYPTASCAPVPRYGMPLVPVPYLRGIPPATAVPVQRGVTAAQFSLLRGMQPTPMPIQMPRLVLVSTSTPSSTPVQQNQVQCSGNSYYIYPPTQCGNNTNAVNATQPNHANKQ